MLPGDRIVLYLTRVMAFAASIRLTGELFEDRAPIWPGKPGKVDPYPWRFPAEPELVVPEGHWVPAEDARRRPGAHRALAARALEARLPGPAAHRLRARRRPPAARSSRPRRRSPLRWIVPRNNPSEMAGGPAQRRTGGGAGAGATSVAVAGASCFREQRLAASRRPPDRLHGVPVVPAHLPADRGPAGVRRGEHERVGAFGWVEGAILLVALAVLGLIYAVAAPRVPPPRRRRHRDRGRRRWAGLLIVYRMLDGPPVSGQGGTAGIEWGIFLGVLAAAASRSTRACACGRPTDPSPPCRRMSPGASRRRLDEDAPGVAPARRRFGRCLGAGHRARARGHRAAADASRRPCARRPRPASRSPAADAGAGPPPPSRRPGPVPRAPSARAATRGPRRGRWRSAAAGPRPPMTGR